MTQTRIKLVSIILLALKSSSCAWQSHHGDIGSSGLTVVHAYL